MQRGAAAKTTMKRRNWVELPGEVTAEIFRRVGAFDVLTGAKDVCRAWREISRDPSIWRHVDFLSPKRKQDVPVDYYVSLCRLAVHLSQGGLTTFAIGYLHNADLLFYLAHRSSQLKRLAFAHCTVSNEVLSSLAGKVPLLEELEFSYCNPAEETIQVYGHFCPLLKTFKLNCIAFPAGEFQGDDEALAIAKYMHGLVHLQIFGNVLSNAGLEAILDACPHLQSLDIRQCFNLDLRGQLGETCAERIKTLRLPHDPTEDCPYYYSRVRLPPSAGYEYSDTSDSSSSDD